MRTISAVIASLALFGCASRQEIADRHLAQVMAQQEAKDRQLSEQQDRQVRNLGSSALHEDGTQPGMKLIAAEREVRALREEQMDERDRERAATSWERASMRSAITAAQRGDIDQMRDLLRDTKLDEEHTARLFSNATESACADIVLASAVESGVTLTADQAAYAFKIECTQTVAAIARHATPDLVVRTYTAIGDQLVPWLQHGDEAVLRPLGDRFAPIVNSTKALCGRVDDTSGACDAMSNLKAKVDAAVNQRVKEEEAYDQGGDLAHRICVARKTINQAKADLAEEQRIARASGVTNLLIRRGCGEDIVAAEKEIAEAKAEFKERTGKAFNQKDWNCE